jgi:tetratricopeptide (TPR) repeat protein
VRSSSWHGHSLFPWGILYNELGDKEDIADCLSLSSQVALSQKDTNTARMLAEESVALSREIGDREGIADSLPLLAQVLAAQGNYAAARTLYEESLVVAGKTSNKLLIAICLEGLADVAVAQEVDGASLTGEKFGRLAALQAAQLWGSAECLRQAIGAPIPPVDRATYEHAVARIRTQLGEQDFAKAWAEGRIMSLEGVSAERIKAMRTQLLTQL